MRGAGNGANRPRRWSPGGQETSGGGESKASRVWGNKVCLCGAEVQPLLFNRYPRQLLLIPTPQVDVTKYADLGPRKPIQDLDPAVAPEPEPVPRRVRTSKKMTGLSELLATKTEPGFVNELVDHMAMPISFRLQGKCGVRTGHFVDPSAQFDHTGHANSLSAHSA